MIGQNPPFITGQRYTLNSGSGDAVSNPSRPSRRRDVGLTPSSPQITEGGVVRLQIYQEASRRGGQHRQCRPDHQQTFDRIHGADRRRRDHRARGLVQDSYESGEGKVLCWETSRWPATLSATTAASAARPTSSSPEAGDPAQQGQLFRVSPTPAMTTVIGQQRGIVGDDTLLRGRAHPARTAADRFARTRGAPHPGPDATRQDRAQRTRPAEERTSVTAMNGAIHLPTASPRPTACCSPQSAARRSGGAARTATSPRSPGFAVPSACPSGSSR